MDNSFKFFENRECEYYPCHKEIDSINCLFCYCPFYNWEECPGRNEYIKRKDGRVIKDCSDCNFPHIPENRDKIIELLKIGKDGYYKMLHSLPAKFYGVGVGPGDENLITKKAEKIIKSVDVLILPAKDKESCRAYVIAEKSIPEIAGKECVFLPFPMSMKEPELSDFHKEAAGIVETYLNRGKSVGFLSIGDVTIYSTYAYIEQLVSEDGYETEYISGIPSFVAAASRLSTYLTLGNDEMHIIPGSADIDEALNLNGTLIFMKSGKRLLELKKRLLEQENDFQEMVGNNTGESEVSKKYSVMAVSNCGMENEIISIGTENITAENGYLTVVIVRKESFI